jgi:undecaprenyl-diphosphatase
MNESWQAVILALIQGLTEFLPVSSSAHLILPSQLLGWEDQGLAFDVAVHVGSLVAVLAYFRRELQDMLSGTVSALRNRALNNQSQLVLLLGVATVPAAAAGLILDDYVSGSLRSTAVIASTTIFFGVLLGLADWRGKGDGKLGFRAAIIIGLAQALALVPGTSRSGITMTAALLCGLDRQAAARFSFLLSIPIILAAGSFKLLEVIESGAAIDGWNLLLGIGISALTAYATIAVFLRLVDRLGFMPFVLYRCVLGLVLFYFLL